MSDTRPIHPAAPAPIDQVRIEDNRDSFWREAFSLQGATTSRISIRAAIFTCIALGIYELNERLIHIDLGVEVAPYEVAGAALGLLLVLRTNAGYDRWWEGRRLWGGIVNQSRTLATTALANGPDDSEWRAGLTRWIAAFAHVVRHTLRNETHVPEVSRLLGTTPAERIAGAPHLPTRVSLEIARILREGYERHGMDASAFLAAENARNLLLDHLGGCERIKRSPLPKVYSISIRRFVVLFLGTLPFALLNKVGWITPLVELLVAYPILALDEIGFELQDPFSTSRMGHLPLDQICQSIEIEMLALGALPAASFRKNSGVDNLLREPRELDPARLQRGAKCDEP
jgi:putative membrane protein